MKVRVEFRYSPTHSNRMAWSFVLVSLATGACTLPISQCRSPAGNGKSQHSSAPQTTPREGSIADIEFTGRLVLRDNQGRIRIILDPESGIHIRDVSGTTLACLELIPSAPGSAHLTLGLRASSDPQCADTPLPLISLGTDGVSWSQLSLQGAAPTDGQVLLSNNLGLRQSHKH